MSLSPLEGAYPFSTFLPFPLLQTTLPICQPAGLCMHLIILPRWSPISSFCKEGREGHKAGAPCVSGGCNHRLIQQRKVGVEGRQVDTVRVREKKVIHSTRTCQEKGSTRKQISDKTLDFLQKSLLEMLDIGQLKLGFPGGKDHMVKICLWYRRPGFNPWVGRFPGGGHGNPLQYSCLENPHGQRNLVGYSPRCCKESDTTERLRTLSTLNTHGRWGEEISLTILCMLEALCFQSTFTFTVSLHPPGQSRWQHQSL